MQPRPLRTTVIGCYPFPGWLEFAASHLDEAVIAAGLLLGPGGSMSTGQILGVHAGWEVS